MAYNKRYTLRRLTALNLQDWRATFG